MGISIFKEQKGMQKQIDIQEAFNIWNMLRARYHSADTLRFLNNFVHDRELSLVIGQFTEDMDGSIKRFEEQVEKLKIKAPNRPPREHKTSAQIDEMSDRFIYRLVYNNLMSELQFIFSAYRTTMTDDKLRSIIRIDLKEHVKQFEIMYKYGKLKGWVDEPPAYKTAKSTKNEPISLSEAFHIRNHISQRYEQLQLTKFFLSFAHDKEFRAILNQGISTLEDEINLLENEGIKYEVPLPDRPPASVAVPMDPETMEDSFMYKQILKGIQDALDLHTRAAVDIIRNDYLRKHILRLYEKELDLHDKFVKYGKLKGWIQVLPTYAEPC